MKHTRRATWWSDRFPARLVAAFGPSALGALTNLAAQAPIPIPGRNVNMVSGTNFPDGDPFLQRQDESSIAVSTRNPLHVFGGANDYRTVDLPGLPNEITGDAWLGVFKSTDGGGTWFSRLLPGYPQDKSPEGLASPPSTACRRRRILSSLGWQLNVLVGEFGPQGPTPVPVETRAVGWVISLPIASRLYRFETPNRT